MGDQHFWGNHAYKIGCAIKPIPLKKLDHTELTTSIAELLSNKTIHDNCVKMAAMLKAENGLEKAVNAIESHFKPMKT